MKARKTKTLSLLISLILVAVGINLIYRVTYLGDSFINAEIRRWADKNFRTELLMQGIIIFATISLLYYLKKRGLTVLFYLFILLFAICLFDFSIQTLSRFSIVTDVALIKSLILFEGIISGLGGIITSIATVIIKDQKEIPASKNRIYFVAIAIASFIIGFIIAFLY